MYWALATLGIALAVGAWMLWQLTVQHGRVLLRLEALEAARAKTSESDRKPKSLPVGAVLHDFELPLLTGSAMTFSQWRGQRFLLIFVDPQCAHCQALASRMPVTPAIPTVIVSTGDPERNRAVFGEQSPVLFQEGTEVAQLFGIVATPSGYLVDAEGAAEQELLVGADALLSVMNHGVPGNGTSPVLTGIGGQPDRSQLKASTPAPDFNLPRLNGGELALSAFSGQNLLLVFSDPNCAPCLPLTAQLEQIHRSSPALRVLIISRGDVQANCDMVGKLGLTLPVVLQRHWEVSRTYGILATPVGYLIDGAGRLGSEAVVGEAAILGLVTEIEKEKPLEQTV